MTHSNPGAESQSVRMVDQRDQDVPIDVRQDGGPPGLVPPGKRVRFKIRANALAYRIDRVFIRDCEHWHVYDVRVGSQSQFLSVGDSSDQDGIPSAAFSSETLCCFSPFETVQAGMELALDVAYCGPVTEGAPFHCLLRCWAAYGDGRNDEVKDLERAAITIAIKNREDRMQAATSALASIAHVLGIQDCPAPWIENTRDAILAEIRYRSLAQSKA